MGATQQRISDIRARQKAGRDSKIVKLARLGWTQEEIAEKMGVSQQSISEITRNTGFGEIGKMLSEGCSMEEIAERFTHRRGYKKEQKSIEEAAMNNEKPKHTWGQSQAGYLAALRGKQVAVVFNDGKAMKGELTGVDTYEIFIKQASGLEVMVGKGAIKYLHPAAAE